MKICVVSNLLAAVALAVTAHATEDGLTLVPQPLDTLQGEIAVVEVPFIIGKALPDTAFHAIGLPYVPPSVSFNEQGNINLASVAGIKVNPFFDSGRKYRIELDYGEVEQEHQTEELLEAVLECVYKVAEADDGYLVDVKITNLKAESPLHKALKRITEEMKKQ
ncbi:hypothetical protein [Haloferula sp. A504]|uniref:hypothetical protein n=1 Tax=Haloferula sp. A504 TaxID=3373601 RepID=UPI0031C21D07|nr:hypothetical protein [Verrucomicrobiaceae bacterium E54]